MEDRQTHKDFLKLGKCLRDRRKQLGLKEQEVAEAVGISRAYLSILETGRNPKTRKPSKPSLEVLAMFSKSLELDLTGLLALAGYSPELIRILCPKSGGSSGERKIGPIAEKIESLCREMRRARNPLPEMQSEEVPSGIPGFRIHLEDHILLLSESESGRDFDLTLQFTGAGLRHGEECIVRLPPSLTASHVERRMHFQRKYSRQLILVPWEEGVIPHYKAHRFSRTDTIRAHRKDLEKARGGGDAIIRFATPDTSHYFAWVENPAEVLEYEKIWPADVRGIDPKRRFLFLCMYRMRDLKKQQQRDLTRTEMILSLLESHDRVMFLTAGDKVLSDGDAVKELLARLDLRNPKPDIWNKIHAIGEKHRVWQA